jgi:hypothetical protein
MSETYDQTALNILTSAYVPPTISKISQTFGEYLNRNDTLPYEPLLKPIKFTRYEYTNSKNSRLVRNYVEADAFLETKLYKHCKVMNEFEILNEEYIRALAQYITQQGYKNVLEVGAGRGRLSYFLKCILDINIHATDSNAWGISNFYTKEGQKRSKEIGLWSPKDDKIFQVEILDIESSLKKYSAELVIICWMPQQTDWTREISKYENVKEILIIGPPDVGITGHIFDTWGGHQKIPNHLSDFTRKTLDFSHLQVCILDSPEYPSHSRTTSYKRI